MTPFRRIVVAVDFSEASAAAWALAAQLGARESRLLALNVVAPPPLPNVAYANIPAAIEEQRRENEARLAQLDARGTRVERRAVTGDIVAEIVDTARETDADLVVIGADPDGRGIAEAVIRNAPCAVLVVKPAG